MWYEKNNNNNCERHGWIRSRWPKIEEKIWGIIRTKGNEQDESSYTWNYKYLKREILNILDKCVSLWMNNFKECLEIFRYTLVLKDLCMRECIMWYTNHAIPKL